MDYIPHKYNFFRYMGGKFFLAKIIVQLIPSDHVCYVEPFCGSAKVLFHKPKSKVEVLNDYNKDVANLFYCASMLFDEFYSKVRFLVPSREIFNKFKDELKASRIDKIPDVERAVKFWYVLNNSIRANGNDFYFKCSKTERTRFYNAYQSLQFVHERLKGVYIENKDFEEVIKIYDSKDTVFYLDPPYYNATNYYDMPFTHQDHERLLNLLKNVKGRWLLSSYKNDFYEEMLKDYNKIELETTKHSSSPNAKVKVVEVIYSNFNLPLDGCKLL